MPDNFKTFYFPWEMDFLQQLQSFHNPVLDKVMLCFTMLAEKGIFWIVISLLLFFFLKNKKPGLTCMGAMVLSFLICNLIIKNIMMRGRPCWEDPSVALLVDIPDDFSFPSGHTSFSFAVASAILQYYAGWGILAIILAGVIGFSRLYLFVHWPTDVIVGAITGIVAGILSGILIRDFYRAHPDFKIPIIEKKEKKD